MNINIFLILLFISMLNVNKLQYFSILRWKQMIWLTWLGRLMVEFFAYGTLS